MISLLCQLWAIWETLVCFLNQDYPPNLIYILQFQTFTPIFALLANPTQSSKMTMFENDVIFHWYIKRWRVEQNCMFVN